ncbi:ABC transporter substrate-binding protein [Spartinivicinus poritis]|uniref:Spermidine/putrescine ABC transporter substrate-binding protein n=1 Tax=Spartinivicinus poritis TaxID=2994640 RepID=A0ABT5U830_9GAMM|nr:spermidine/putrescine ABC transporter substrate-binding protein [Spartinivicinus sp. A2-2]MDE1461682.1 spermidine/putrescine ABC transporter substrate-binding protein [Spartinivicinus sp. A2-2]
MRFNIFFLIIIWLSCNYGVLAHAAVSNTVKTDQPELSVLIRYNYLSPTVYKQFEQKYNVKIKLVYYSSDDDRNLLLLESDGRGVDVVCVDSTSATAYIASGWITPLTDFELKNTQYIDSHWLTQHNLLEKFAVPYFWKVLGIAFHNERLKEPIKHWSNIINPSPSLYSKILMPPTAHETVAITLLSLGYSANSTSINALQKAELTLTKQRPFVLWTSDIRYPATGSINENLWVSAVYNGEAYALMRSGVPIEFTIPSEGSVMILDYLAVAEESEKKQLAATFIDFLNEPHNAAENAHYVAYSSPNAAARALLPEPMQQSPWLYPSLQVMQKLELLLPLPSTATKKISQIYFHLQ